MFRSFLKILLLIALYFSAPRPTFWHDVSLLDDPNGDEATEEALAAIKAIPTHYAQTFTEFYCNASTGSNLNGGSDSGSPSMSDTSNTGSWTSTTNVYVSTATTGTVTVGQFASIYSSGASIAAYTASITAVSGGSGSAWTITLSSTAIAGAKPSTAASYNMQVGGCWQGPNGASGFPFGYAKGTLTDAGGDVTRVNFKNNATYSITAAMTHGLAGPVVFQGYTSSPGDQGKAIIDGGTSGASYTLLTVSTGPTELWDFTFQNNGASGSSSAVTLSASPAAAYRCVFTSTRGAGILLSGIGSSCSECEAYACNQSNTANTGGFTVGGSGGGVCVACISHDNVGSNSNGFHVVYASLINCIANTNGGSGFHSSGNTLSTCLSCVAYNNTGSGIQLTSTACPTIINCIFSLNGAYGISISSANSQASVFNCAYYNNTSGPTNGANINETGAITLSGDPFNDAANGDFSLNATAGAGAACTAAGFGTFPAMSGYSKTTVSYPAVGAAQPAATAADYPSPDDVRYGTTYDSGLKTGDMTLPATTDVKTGVQYGTNGTQYTGSYSGGGGGPGSVNIVRGDTMFIE